MCLNLGQSLFLSLNILKQLLQIVPVLGFFLSPYFVGQCLTLYCFSQEISERKTGFAGK